MTTNAKKIGKILGQRKLLIINKEVQFLKKSLVSKDGKRLKVKGPVFSLQNRIHIILCFKAKFSLLLKCMPCFSKMLG